MTTGEENSTASRTRSQPMRFSEGIIKRIASLSCAPYGSRHARCRGPSPTIDVQDLRRLAYRMNVTPWPMAGSGRRPIQKRRGSPASCVAEGDARIVRSPMGRTRRSMTNIYRFLRLVHIAASSAPASPLIEACLFSPSLPRMKGGSPCEPPHSIMTSSAYRSHQ